jgi:hypothetical protein
MGIDRPDRDGDCLATWNGHRRDSVVAAVFLRAIQRHATRLLAGAPLPGANIPAAIVAEVSDQQSVVVRIGLDGVYVPRIADQATAYHGKPTEVSPHIEKSVAGAKKTSEHSQNVRLKYVAELNPS